MADEFSKMYPGTTYLHAAPGTETYQKINQIETKQIKSKHYLKKQSQNPPITQTGFVLFMLTCAVPMTRYTRFYCNSLGYRDANSDSVVSPRVADVWKIAG